MSSTFVRSTLSFVAVAGLGFGACASAQDDHPVAPPDDHESQEDVFVLETDDGDGQVAPRVQFFNRMPGGAGVTALAFGPRARLGVVVETTDDGLAVGEVQPDSLAASAGVQAGDLIHRVGKRRIQTTADVALALRGRQAGDEVSIAVIRDGVGLVELQGTVPELPDDGFTAAPGGALLGVDLDEQDGRVVVAGVVAQSAAWFAGVEKGDVLVSLDGRPMASAQDVVDFVTAREPGDFVAVGVERDGDTHELRARLGARTGADRLLRFTSPGALDGDLGMLLPRGLSFGQGGGSRAFGLPGGKGAYALRLHGDHEPFGEWHTWLEKLHEDGVLDGDARRTRIEIKDGVMTIERDGEVETYQLDELEEAPFPRPRRLHGHDDDEDGPHDAGWRTGPQDV